MRTNPTHHQPYEALVAKLNTKATPTVGDVLAMIDDAEQAHDALTRHEATRPPGRASNSPEHRQWDEERKGLAQDKSAKLMTLIHGLNQRDIAGHPPLRLDPASGTLSEIRRRLKTTAATARWPPRLTPPARSPYPPKNKPRTTPPKTCMMPAYRPKHGAIKNCDCEVSTQHRSEQRTVQLHHRR